jgi:hypothetical protein
MFTLGFWCAAIQQFGNQFIVPTGLFALVHTILK